jgi:alanine dehydrogenase
MVKTHVTWGGHSTLHAIGAAFDGAGYVGGKIWAHTPGGATPLLVLYSASTGALKAVIEAFVLGQLRTGGISGLAAKLLSSPDAEEMALIGVGKQAMAQIASVAAVRPLKRVKVWSPTEAKRRAFADQAAAELGLDVRATATLEQAVGAADVITLATRANAPFLTSAMVKAGAHINAVGAITPERAEFDPALLSRCAVVAVDSLDQVKNLSQEFRTFYGQDEAGWETVKPLFSLINRPPPRPADDRITLFKAMGMGISDLALGIEIHRRAMVAGIGRPIPTPKKAKPRLTRAPVQKVADHV